MSDTNNALGNTEASEHNEPTSPVEGVAPVLTDLPSSQPADGPAAADETPAESVDGSTADTQPQAAPAPPATPAAAAKPIIQATPTITTPQIVGQLSAEEFAKMQEDEKKRREEERERKEHEKKVREAAFAKLSEYKNNNEAFSVTIAERVKGGLRCDFEGLRVFLPASHFSAKKNTTEAELNEAVGSSVSVKIHDLQNDENGLITAVVSRRDILLHELWDSIVPGSIHDAVVSSVVPFGAFVNIGGVEGLIHISQLSKTRIATADEVVKKGDKIKVTVLEVDKEKKKLSLSHKEHEADPWSSVADVFKIGTVVKGIVRRITDFGAYIQVASRVEGLLRASELSWTRRIKHPSDVLTVGQEIEVVILELNLDKHQMALGYKQIQPNPWNDIESKLPVGTNIKGIVQKVTPQGAVVRLLDEFDGFMPRSKMGPLKQGAKAPFEVNSEIECCVVDLNAASASVIIAALDADGTPFSGGSRGGSVHEGGSRHRDSQAGTKHTEPAASGVTIGDLLRETDKSKLNS
ncbi:MAG: 30S ribosomal protein S1 [Flavobacteriales bacterium]|nr:MAG: 30S ribosomal protein S1 [Bacteroidota bacterium]KXK35021.1 MAG: 30S ribosomal protein S1 [Chlorobi bacterium OLB6]MBE2265780.1 30S ribosomal protein S1 [Flavobacteriales bacterium]MBV6464058.1 Polyribonucleotide nucleotidyltransferase [Chlorobiota bacterium]MBW7853739.1 30S ribosomal protein S1 [Candidatus Kapabacteria bacterium]MCC6331531.1 30S ribosomal protein S1 [Ignavibacteria bacterium]